MVKSILGVLGALVGIALALAGVAALIWFLWWLWTRHEEEAPVVEIEVDVPPLAAEPPAIQAEIGAEKPAVAAELVEEAPEEVSAPPMLDDLKRIEGIGPKIASVLQEAGITSFAQLADVGVSGIERILEEADPRLLRFKPDTWAEQASLAAAGEWEALEALQNELRGGRRV